MDVEPENQLETTKFHSSNKCQLPLQQQLIVHKTYQVPGSVAAAECKSVFDLVTRTATPNCAEHRTQLNALAIKDMLAEGVQLRWVHSGA